MATVDNGTAAAENDIADFVKNEVAATTAQEALGQVGVEIDVTPEKPELEQTEETK